MMSRKKNLARPTEGVSEAGSGVPGGDGGATGHPTGSTDSLGADDTVVADSGDLELSDDTDLEDLTVLDASDPTLGLTNYGDIPPDDWAADTGPTHSAEEDPKGVSRDLVDQDETEDGEKIDFDR
jgi:hypothetical protein